MSAGVERLCAGPGVRRLAPSIRIYEPVPEKEHGREFEDGHHKPHQFPLFNEGENDRKGGQMRSQKNGSHNPKLAFSEKLLAEEFVAVVPGEAFGTNEHIRISYATSMKELERGLDRLQRFIAARL